VIDSSPGSRDVAASSDADDSDEQVAHQLAREAQRCRGGLDLLDEAQNGSLDGPRQWGESSPPVEHGGAGHQDRRDEPGDGVEIAPDEEQQPVGLAGREQQYAPGADHQPAQ
jgi:hypothetical protein